MSCRRHEGCHFVSFVIYISGAKFKERYLNVSRDILDWVLNCFTGTTYDVINYNTKTWISLKQKKIFQKGKRHSSLLWKAFQISSNYFLLHRHFKVQFNFKNQLSTCQRGFFFSFFLFSVKKCCCVVLCKKGKLKTRIKCEKFS